MPVRAELVYALTGQRGASGLAFFDSATPGAATTVGALSGVVPNHLVLGLDWRPATGQMYAVSVDLDAGGTSGQLYTVDLQTAALTPVGSGFTLTGNTSTVSIDFNPTVDRLRIISGNRKSYRVNPDTGGLVMQDADLAYAAGDPGETSTPLPVGVAYINNVAGALTTTLYARDVNRHVLATVVPPNAGVLNTVGGPGPLTPLSADFGFDVSGATGNAYVSYTDFAGGEVFATMNLATGVPTVVGNFGINVLDISVVPAPSGVMLGLVGTITLGRRRR